MMSIARVSASAVTTGACLVGLAWWPSSTRPFRSSPRRVYLTTIAVTEAMRSPKTRARMKALRRRSVTKAAYRWSAGGRQDEQQAAVVVVRREQVRGRLGGEIALRVHLDRLALRAHPPLENLPEVVGPVGEVQSEHLARRAADDLLEIEPGQLERPAAAMDQAALLVAGEERGVGRRVVVVEQLEHEREATLRASAGLAPEPPLAVRRGLASPAIRAD